MGLPASEPEFDFRVAESAEEVEAHLAVRHDVFVVEQGLFETTDRDDRDADARTRHLVAVADHRVVGAVRILPLDPDGVEWLGDRLAVAPDFRAYSVGAGLVRLAVATAGALGGSVMHAHIQMPNVRFFVRLGWVESGPLETYVGVPHQPMSITLGGAGGDSG